MAYCLVHPPSLGQPMQQLMYCEKLSSTTCVLQWPVYLAIPVRIKRLDLETLAWWNNSSGQHLGRSGAPSSFIRVPAPGSPVHDAADGAEGPFVERQGAQRGLDGGVQGRSRDWTGDDLQDNADYVASCSPVDLR